VLSNTQKREMTFFCALLFKRRIKAINNVHCIRGGGDECILWLNFAQVQQVWAENLKLDSFENNDVRMYIPILISKG
jgi:hypothetical protein